MSALIISTLRDKRLEVVEATERLERQVDQHRADLAHLEATMRLVDPNADQTGKAEVLEVVALIFQLVLQHGQPQQGRRPPVVGDKAQGQRRLIIRVEIRPIHGHDDRLARAHNFRHPRGEHVPHDDAFIAKQPVDLLDRVLTQKAARLGQGLADH